MGITHQITDKFNTNIWSDGQKYMSEFANVAILED